MKAARQGGGWPPRCSGISIDVDLGACLFLSALRALAGMIIDPTPHLRHDRDRQQARLEAPVGGFPWPPKAAGVLILERGGSLAPGKTRTSRCRSLPEGYAITPIVNSGSAPDGDPFKTPSESMPLGPATPKIWGAVLLNACASPSSDGLAMQEGQAPRWGPQATRAGPLV